MLQGTLRCKNLCHSPWCPFRFIPLFLCQSILRHASELALCMTQACCRGGNLDTLLLKGSHLHTACICHSKLLKFRKHNGCTSILSSIYTIHNSFQSCKCFLCLVHLFFLLCNLDLGIRAQSSVWSKSSQYRLSNRLWLLFLCTWLWRQWRHYFTQYEYISLAPTMEYRCSIGNRSMFRILLSPFPCILRPFQSY